MKPAFVFYRWLFFVFLLVSQTDIRRWTGSTRTIEETFTLDIANVAKIGLWVAAFFICLAVLLPRARYLASPAAALLLALYGWFFLLVPVAPSPFKSFLVLVTVVSGVFVVMTHLMLFGRDRFVKDLVNFQILFLGVSILTYFALPSFSRFLLWDGTVGVRLTGLGGHPNSIGAIASLTGVLVVSCFKSLGWSRNRMIVYMGIVLLALVLTQSRTSMIGLILGCGVYFLAVYPQRGLLFFGAISAGAAILLFFTLNPHALAFLSRSGDVNELATGTGRTFVWAQAWRLISESPIYGYGYNSTWFLFQDLAFVLEQFVGDYVFPHSHNLYLQVLLSGGVVALAIFLAGVLAVLYIGMALKRFDLLALTVCYLGYTMTEAAGFFQYPETYNLLLSTCFALANHYYVVSRRQAGGRQRAGRLQTGRVGGIGLAGARR